MWLVDTKTINRFSKPISQFVLYQGRRDTMKVSFFFLDCFFFLFLVFFAGSCDKQSNMTLVTNLWAMAQEVLLKGHHPPCQTQKKKDTFFHKCLYKLLDMCIETLFYLFCIDYYQVIYSIREKKKEIVPMNALTIVIWQPKRITDYETDSNLKRKTSLYIYTLTDWSLSIK